MNRISGTQTLFIVTFAAIRRELLMLCSVQVVKRAGNKVSRFELLLLDEWFKKASSYDLKAFLRTCRPPGGFNSADDVAEPF